MTRSIFKSQQKQGIFSWRCCEDSDKVEGIRRLLNSQPTEKSLPQYHQDPLTLLVNFQWLRSVLYPTTYHRTLTSVVSLCQEIEHINLFEIQKYMIRDAHTFDYSKFLNVENWLSSLECRCHVYESYSKRKRKVYWLLWYYLYRELCWVKLNNQKNL